MAWGLVYFKHSEFHNHFSPGLKSFTKKGSSDLEQSGAGRKEKKNARSGFKSIHQTTIQKEKEPSKKHTIY
jgi:hypothetical protein